MLDTDKLGAQEMVAISSLWLSLSFSLILGTVVQDNIISTL